MAISLTPYGQLANGNLGVLLDPVSKKPLASAIEILNALPSVASTDNFQGRVVFNTNDNILYSYSEFPTPAWNALEGIPATVGNVAGVPPVIPTPQDGALYYDLDTSVLFVWDGSAWIGAGGAFAATIVDNTHTGDGVTSVFPSGTSTVVTDQYIEVFLDGVRQIPGTDYSAVGTTVQFITAPSAAVIVHIRVIVSAEIAQNSQISSASHTATLGQTEFSTGQVASDPAGVLVFVDGQLKTGGGVDYTLNQQSTVITSFVKTGTTTARATTAQVHGIPVSAAISLDGFSEPEFNGVTYTVTATPTTTTFDVTVSASDPATGTGNPTMTYSPAFVNDAVDFVVPMAGGEIVDIRSLRSVVVSGAQGEANTLLSSGTGIGLDNTKTGVALRIKSLLAGANIGIVDNGDDITISANNGLAFEDRNGVNAAFNTVSGESYLGIRNTTSAVVVDLSTIAQSASNSGRRLTVKDESGGAGINNIAISAGSALIEGAANYVINTNRGAVTMVFDGTDWHVTSAKI